jgi:NAD(P)-dependent dehydrogenase (short-subunit alcohol dehydrogenase family)
MASDHLNASVNQGRALVITGASTGIGAACAVHFARRGFTVFAGVRRQQDGAVLKRQASSRLTPVMLDVTDAESIRQASAFVQDGVGVFGLWGLVNNAGIAVAGPLEAVPVEDWRRQFDVNVIGQVAVTQAFLPLLRQGRGRIVNMGSIAGLAATPFIGPYCASKHALEALTDALRLEVRQWGIQVSIIEPGAIATPIWEKSGQGTAQLEASASGDLSKLYAAATTGVKQAFAEAAARAVSPDAVVRAVEHALTAPRPKTRYLVGTDAKLRALMAKLLPDRVADWLMIRILKLPH